MDSYRLRLNLEYDYRLEVIKPNGFIKDKYDINQEELVENMNDLCLLVTGNEEDADRLKSKKDQDMHMIKIYKCKIEAIKEVLKELE